MDTIKIELPTGTVLEAPPMYVPAKDPKRRHYRKRGKSRPARPRVQADNAAVPGSWTPEFVGLRLIEAVQVIEHLPSSKGPAGLQTAWPPIVRNRATAPKRTMTDEQWEEALQDAISHEEARDETAKKQWAFGARRTPPAPDAISRAYAVMGWPLRFLTGRTYWRHLDGRVTATAPKPDMVMRLRNGGRQRERVNLWTSVKCDDDGMARILRAWVVAKVKGRGDGNDDINRICKKHGWAVSTFRRKRSQALALIAAGLNAAGERVF